MLRQILEPYLADYDFGKNILSSMPSGALFFVHGDVASMSVDYLQMVEGFRPDVKVLDQEKLTYKWYVAQVKKRFPEIVIRGERYDGVKLLNLNLIEDNIKKFPIFFSVTLRANSSFICISPTAS